MTLWSRPGTFQVRPSVTSRQQPRSCSVAVFESGAMLYPITGLVGRVPPKYSPPLIPGRGRRATPRLAHSGL